MIKRIVKDTTTQTFESKKNILEVLNHYRSLSKEGLDLLSESEIAELKIKFDKFLNINLSLFADSYPTKLFRITNNKHLTGGRKLKLQKISDLIGPPKELSNINRCNLKGESIFYAALDFNTAIWETQPQVGDYITVSEWKIKEGQRLNNHFIFHPIETNLSKESQSAFEAHVKAAQEINPGIYEIFIEIIKFVCEEFMKPVDNSNKVNYLFSSIVSSRLLQTPPDSNGFQIESISYPSIKRDHKVTNIAILNSLVLERLDLTAVTILDVMETNYTLEYKNRNDFIKVSPLQTVAKEFDFVNDKIKYDLQKELKDMIELDRKYGNKKTF